MNHAESRTASDFFNSLLSRCRRAFTEWVWATIATLLATAKLNGIDPYAWLALTLERIAAGCMALQSGREARDNLDENLVSRRWS